MPVLMLKLLGQMECNLPSGTPLSLSTRKSEVLLAYLALAPGVRHPRDRLINLLWSDRGEDQARNSLRQSLSSIKKAFESEIPELLEIERTTVKLVSNQIRVDAHEFEQLIDDPSLVNLTKAAELYQGEFLEGITIRDTACQEWLANERDRLRRLVVEALFNLSRLQIAEPQYKAAIESAERLVDYDPLQESGWRLLMTAYHHKGDRNHALMAYKRCRDILDNELSVAPEAETNELQELIKKGNLNRPISLNLPIKHKSGSIGPVAEAASKDHSILVLPFKNLSDDSEQQYFSDGLTEGIIMGLSLFPSLRVHSRHSSFAANEQDLSIGEIGQKFDALYVVEGSVRKTHHQVRISAQLINTQSGEQIWGKRFDNKFEETFSLEDQVTQSIVAIIKGKIDITDQEISYRKPAKDMKSYDLLMRGKFHLLRFTPEDNRIGMELLQKCLAIDPDNAAAHNHVYNGYISDWVSGWTEPRSESISNAGFHISKAIELKTDDSNLQADYAEYQAFIGEYDQAEVYADRAFRLNPNDTETLATISGVQASLGHVQTSLDMADACRRLDPFHPWVDWVIGIAYYRGKKYQDALSAFKKMQSPADEIDGWIAACYHRLGNYENATKHLNLYLEIARKNRVKFPESLDEWQQIWQATAAYRHEEGIDYPFEALCEAGLKQFVEGSTTPQAQQDLHSIAVLPFDNLSGDPKQEYFSDGITESIILNLSLFPGLQVKSRNSSFAFKQQIKSLGEISKELNVNYVVEGSIRKSDERIRITVQLIEAENGNQIWGKRFDSDLSDLFTLEEELSRTIAATVTGQIETDLQRIAISKGAVHQDSYDLLLSGTYHCNKITRPDMAIAIEKLNQCLEQDPDNVRAHVTLYTCHSINTLERWVVDPQASFKLAGEHIQIALSLGPHMGYVQTAHAEYLVFCRDSGKALEHVDKALQLNPNDPDALTVKAFALEMLGKHEQALKLAELAQRLDPYHPWVDWNLAECQIFSNQYEKALETISNSNNDPGLLKIYSIVANINLGRTREAQRALKELLQECRSNMLSIPSTLEDWLQYTKTYIPMENTSINEDIVNCMVEAGLKEEMDSHEKPDYPDQQPSILVLPFDNLSGDPEQEYFSDGITESIILTLSSSSGLKVKSRHTSFAYKNSHLSVSDIGDELGIQYIVEGSIRRQGDKVRVTVQLGEAASGNQIWGKRYDRPMDDLFALEEELVQTIAGTISGRIGHEIKVASAKKSTRNLKSFEYLARGNYHMENFTANETILAREMFKKCIEIDPDNSDAHTGLAIAMFVELFENWAADREDWKEQALEHLRTALRLEPENALTHAYLSEFQLFTRDFELGMYHAERSIELGPHLPDGYAIKGYLLAAGRKFDEALELADLSMQIDPYHYYMGWNSGQTYRMAGQYQKALDTFRSIPHASPSLSAEKAACYVGLGQEDKARGEMQTYHSQAREQMVDYPQTAEAWRAYWYENVPYQYDEDFECYFDQLLKAGLCDHINEVSDDFPSIAVLPFENMSGDPEQEYFSDGITNDIVTTLSHIRSLRVVARYSTLAYKNQKPEISQIAEEQGVRYILDGSVRKSGNRVRVNAQLIDSRSGENCWGENYDRDLDDIFVVQDEITKNITVAMQVHLIAGESAREISVGTNNLKAWEYCFVAANLQDSYITDNIIEARRLVGEALKLDPEYNWAWTVLGWTHWQEVYCGWSQSIEDSLREANLSVEKSLTIDPDSGEAWVLKGCIYIMEEEPVLAIDACEKAVSLSPGNAEVQALMAYALNYAGQTEKALPYHEASIRLCPVCPNWFLLVGGSIYRQSGDINKAIETFQKAVNIEPESPLARYYLIDSLMEAGRLNEAKKWAEEIHILDNSFRISGLILNYSHDRKEREKFRANLAEIGFTE